MVPDHQPVRVAILPVVFLVTHYGVYGYPLTPGDLMALKVFIRAGGSDSHITGSRIWRRSKYGDFNMGGTPKKNDNSFFWSTFPNTLVDESLGSLDFLKSKERRAAHKNGWSSTLVGFWGPTFWPNQTRLLKIFIQTGSCRSQESEHTMMPCEYSTPCLSVHPGERLPGGKLNMFPSIVSPKCGSAHDVIFNDLMEHISQT